MEWALHETLICGNNIRLSFRAFLTCLFYIVIPVKSSIIRVPMIKVAVLGNPEKIEKRGTIGDINDISSILEDERKPARTVIGRKIR